ncbi:hypothetical protein KQ945_05995 [Bacillus subtilis subsp. subtilis]|nr:hypothetical protein [Bacillus subtilis subsp. subtilis]
MQREHGCDGIGIHPYAAVVGPHDRAGNGQSQSGTIGISTVARALGAEQAFKQRRQRIGRNHRPGVADGGAVIEAALAGVGICQMPPFLVKAHLQSGALQQVLGHCLQHHLGIHARWPPTRQLRPKVRHVVDEPAKLADAGAFDWAGLADSLCRQRVVAVPRIKPPPGALARPPARHPVVIKAGPSGGAGWRRMRPAQPRRAANRGTRASTSSSSHGASMSSA